MLIDLLDANGATQTVSVRGQEAVTDASGTIAAGGTAQQLLAPNTNRSGWFFENLSIETLYLNEGGTPVAGGGPGDLAVAPGAFISSRDYPLTTDILNVIGATTGSKFTCKEW